MSKSYQIRNALKNLLVGAQVLEESKIYLSKLDSTDLSKLPIIKILPSSSSNDSNTSSDSNNFYDKKNYKIVIEAKSTRLLSVDLALEELEEKVINAVRQNESELKELVSYIKYTDSDYSFDDVNDQTTGGCSIEFECLTN